MVIHDLFDSREAGPKAIKDTGMGRRPEMRATMARTILGQTRVRPDKSPHDTQPIFRQGLERWSQNEAFLFHG